MTRHVAMLVALVALPLLALAPLAAALQVMPATQHATIALVALLLLGSMLAARNETTIGSVSLAGDWIFALLAVCTVPTLAPLLALALLTDTSVAWRPRIASCGAEALTLAAAAWLATQLGAPAATPLQALGIVVGAAAALLATNVLVMLAPMHLHGIGLRSYVVPAGLSTAAMLVVATPVVLLVSPSPETDRLWMAPLALGPLVAIVVVHRLYERALRMRDELAAKAQVLARTNLQFAAAMVRALDQRDAYTAGHSAAVAVYTRDIAREMGFDDETVRMAHLSGLLHDIGKIGVPGRVLNKTAPLDDEEYELMKSHAAMGAEILGEVDLYADVAAVVRWHHERIDGRDYPDGIAGEAIPAITRMISVADTYSAMTTDRPYRDGMPTEQAMRILRECRGTQLDPDFTDAFLRILATADATYQRGTQADFEVEVAKHQAMSEVEAETIRLDEPPATPVGPASRAVEIALEREAA
jgi:putative nucleotidyltransferase with HDIG domain